MFEAGDGARLGGIALIWGTGHRRFLAGPGESLDVLLQVVFNFGVPVPSVRGRSDPGIPYISPTRQEAPQSPMTEQVGLQAA